VVVLLLALPVGLLAVLYDPARLVLERAWPVCIPASLGYVVAYLLADRRAKRLIDESDAMICPRCRYHLAGLDEQGTCPECGQPYGADDLRELWHRVYWSHDGVPE
jgi:hypothetical protein